MNAPTGPVLSFPKEHSREDYFPPTIGEVLAGLGFGSLASRGKGGLDPLAVPPGRFAPSGATTASPRDRGRALPPRR
jgi:hypothetical protein